YYLQELEKNRSDEINKDGDLDQQRSKILELILPKILTRRTLKDFEKKLLKTLKHSQDVSDTVTAVATALFFLEMHKKHPERAFRNPLWDLVFYLSFSELDQKNPSSSSPVSSGGQDKRKENWSNIIKFWNVDLSDASMQILHEALEKLESGNIEIGFSFDTVLQGLRVYLNKSRLLSPEQLVAEFRITFEREIGEHEREDLLWGLEYAIDTSKSDRKKAFEILRNGIELLPARENIVVFAVYYKCIMEFYRYLKPEELDLAKAIIQAPNETGPLLEYARYLYNIESPHRAIKVFEAVLNVDSGNNFARLGLGIVLWFEDSQKEAKMHWKKVISADADDSIKQMCEQLVLLNESDHIPESAHNIFQEPFL
ncbi:hypothetical protein JW979_06140, partial [bacterium]|nr:hypothetical protein [candidate division CSSED10-310 bacterium]